MEKNTDLKSTTYTAHRYNLSIGWLVTTTILFAFRQLLKAVGCEIKSNSDLMTVLSIQLRGAECRIEGSEYLINYAKYERN